MFRLIFSFCKCLAANSFMKKSFGVVHVNLEGIHSFVFITNNYDPLFVDLNSSHQLLRFQVLKKTCVGRNVL